MARQGYDWLGAHGEWRPCCGPSAVPILMGFGVPGIVGGSVAAGMQAAFGNIAAGSAFTVAQSLRMQSLFVTAGYVGSAAGAVLKLSGKEEG